MADLSGKSTFPTGLTSGQQAHHQMSENFTFACGNMVRGPMRPAVRHAKPHGTSFAYSYLPLHVNAYPDRYVV